jgi:hypothetical protein
MMADFSIHYLRFHLEPSSPLHVPACLRATHRQAYNKGSVMRGGISSACRLSVASAQAGRIVRHWDRREAIGNRQE